MAKPISNQQTACSQRWYYTTSHARIQLQHSACQDLRLALEAAINQAERAAMITLATLSGDLLVVLTVRWASLYSASRRASRAFSSSIAAGWPRIGRVSPCF